MAEDYLTIDSKNIPVKCISDICPDDLKSRGRNIKLYQSLLEITIKRYSSPLNVYGKHYTDFVSEKSSETIKNLELTPPNDASLSHDFLLPEGKFFYCGSMNLSSVTQIIIEDPTDLRLMSSTTMDGVERG